MAAKPNHLEIQSPPPEQEMQEDVTSSLDLKAAGKGPRKAPKGDRGKKMAELMARLRVQSAIWRAKGMMMYQRLKARKLHYPFWAVVVALPTAFFVYPMLSSDRVAAPTKSRAARRRV